MCVGMSACANTYVHACGLVCISLCVRARVCEIKSARSWVCVLYSCVCAYVREREIDPSVREYAHHLCAASLIESVRVRAYIRKRDCVYECFFVFCTCFFRRSTPFFKFVLLCSTSSWSFVTLRQQLFRSCAELRNLFSQLVMIFTLLLSAFTSWVVFAMSVCHLFGAEIRIGLGFSLRHILW